MTTVGTPATSIWPTVRVVAVMRPIRCQQAPRRRLPPARLLLLRSAELAGSAAGRLPEGEALLLRGNGALTLGATPGVAVARRWLLSAACDTFLTARAAL